MKNVVITGANRGIGLALTRKYLKEGFRVFAGCRSPQKADELKSLQEANADTLTILTLDVSDPASCRSFGKELQGTPIDILLNNAGIATGRGEGISNFERKNLLDMFTVNTLGPMEVTRNCLESLKAAKQPIVGNVSSKVGSIEDNGSGGMYGYRMSKTALNMANKCMALECPDITFVSLHPGWVLTDMGGSSAPTTIEESGDGLFDVVARMKQTDSGKFYDFRGKEIPW